MSETKFLFDNIYSDKARELLIESFEYFTKLKHISNLFETQESYEKAALFYGVIGSNFINYIDDLNQLLTKYEVFDFILSAISYLNSNQIEDIDLVNNVREMISCLYVYTDANVDERKIHILGFFLHISNKILPMHGELRRVANESKRLEILINLLKNEKFMDKYYEKFKSFFGNLVFSLNWISKEAEPFKDNWHNLNSIELILKYSKKFQNYQIYFYMISANVAYDKDIENYSDMMLALDTFVDLANKTVEDYGDLFIDQQFIDDTNENKQISCSVSGIIEDKTRASISITGTLLALYRLAINSKIKLELFNKQNLRTSLKYLLNNGNEIEKQYSAQLIAQLSFNDEVNKILNEEEKDLIETIKELSKVNNFEFKKLRKTCEQLVWILSDKSKTIKNLDTQKDSPQLKNHLMISYNTGSRELCLKIKKSLEDLNFKIWIDVEEIHGSSLDSMARAVENAEIVLMCVTEKYRQSVNCQAEAQYAFRLNKKIIPLIMQKGYSNVDGWLGIIIGDKIFIDFTKYEYNDCISRLLNQVSKLTNTTPPKIENTMPANPVKLNPNQENLPAEQNLALMRISNSIAAPTQVALKLNEAEKWNETQVEKWFQEKNLLDIFKIIKPIDGATLYQLYQFQIYSPEFFYKSLTKSDSIDIKQLANFSAALKDLYKN